MPSVTFSPDEKVKIACALDEAGVHVIEAGFPPVSKAEKEAVSTIAAAGLRAEIEVIARTMKSDIDAAIDCGVNTVALFIGTSPYHLQYKLQISFQEAVKRACDAVEYAKERGIQVIFAAEDATRTETSSLLEIYRRVEEAGADILAFPDTVGIMYPARMRELVRCIVNQVGVPLTVHCHNDLGLAVANTLAGVEGGAMGVQCSVNGLGERSGNAALDEVVIGLNKFFGFDLDINTDKFFELSRLVSELSGIPLHSNKPLVGDNAFACESGVHALGVMRAPQCYEPFQPELVGNKRHFFFGKHSGKNIVAETLESHEIDINKEILQKILEILKRSNISLDQNQLIALAKEVKENVK